MLDLGWPELLVVALVLILVVGPKDLPGMLRTFGRTTRKLRSMAGEFRSQFDEALKEAELDDVRSVISEAQQLNPKSILKDVVDPIAEVGNEIKSDLDKTMREATAPSPSEPGAAKPNGEAADKAKVEAKPKAEKKSAKRSAKSSANGAAKKKSAATTSRTRKTTAKTASKPTAAKRTATKKPTASTTRKKPAASKSAKSSGDAA